MTAETATIGPRMLSASSKMAATSSAGATATRVGTVVGVTGFIFHRRNRTITS